MPIFEYRCRSCGDESEVIVLPSEAAPERCSACDGELERRWSRIGVRLVGWGFARTDALIPESRDRRSFKEISQKASELFD